MRLVIPAGIIGEVNFLQRAAELIGQRIQLVIGAELAQGGIEALGADVVGGSAVEFLEGLGGSLVLLQVVEIPGDDDSFVPA